MKKSIGVICLIGILISLLFITTNEAQADSPASGSWTAGTEVTIDLEKTPAPNEWVQLFGSAVQVTEPTEICHPFRGGQFGWTPEIRRLKNGKWMQLDTTMRRLPNNEGPLYACTNAPAAGTYALFGYYNGPLEIPGTQASTCSLSLDGWTAETITPNLYVFLDNLDEGTMVHFKQLTTDPQVTLTSTEGDVPVEVKKYKRLLLTTFSETGGWEIQIEVSVQGCSRTFTFTDEVE
mgnify:FL=1